MTENANHRQSLIANLPGWVPPLVDLILILVAFLLAYYARYELQLLRPLDEAFRDTRPDRHQIRRLAAVVLQHAVADQGVEVAVIREARLAPYLIEGPGEKTVEAQIGRVLVVPAP